MSVDSSCVDFDFGLWAAASTGWPASLVIDIRPSGIEVGFANST